MPLKYIKNIFSKFLIKYVLGSHLFRPMGEKIIPATNWASRTFFGSQKINAEYVFPEKTDFVRLG